MEDVSPPSDSALKSPLPQAGHDPDDPLRPEIEEENSTADAPIAAPEQDMEATEDADLPAGADDLSDNESILSEVDEAQFEDFDPANIAIEDRPVAVDESNVALLGVHKRKRADDGGADGKKKKKKEGRREKTKKHRKRRDEDDDFEGGEQVEGKRRVKKAAPEKKERRRVQPDPELDEQLTPEERRRRALDRAMDEALRNPNLRRKKGGIDLYAMADAEIEDMRRRMAEAAKADTEARMNGQPAMHKLKMLPEVVAMLNRNTLQNSLVDPDINLLEAVRFFLEPLNDGSLPAYNIQRELFAALGRLPISKDSLVASEIGKVVLFYTKSKMPEPGIKRQANKLLTDWTRPIVRRTDDYRKRALQEVTYDPTRLPVRTTQNKPGAAAAAARERALATPVRTNRARLEGGLSSYNVVPRSNLAGSSQVARAPGASGDEFFRRMKARQMARGGGRR